MFTELDNGSNNSSSEPKKFKKDIPKTQARATSTKLFQEIKTTAKTNSLVNSKNWTDAFAPTKSDDLALHSKKLQEIKQWLLHCSAMKHKNPAQICLITGPSGCGKTTALQVLAKESNICIQEWINPVDQEVVHNLGDQIIGQTYVNSQLDAFKNFLFKASRYRSLLESSAVRQRLLLVEDFPNFLLRDPTSINEILE